jgi:glutamate dehydrogenase/leucine dehydrogenase
MTYTVSSDIKRALSAKGFLFGMAGMVLMLAVASISTITSVKGLQPNGFHAQLILSGLTSEDVTLVLPVFLDGELSGFAACRAHHADIGGPTAGGMPAGSRRLQDEG